MANNNSNNSWMNDPILKNISKEKMDVLNNILSTSKNLEPKQMLAHFIQESNNASKNGVNFTDEETEAIMKVLKPNMTPEELKKIDMIKKMVKIISSKKTSRRPD